MLKPATVAIAVGSLGLIALLFLLVLKKSQGSIPVRAWGPAPLTASEPATSLPLGTAEVEPHPTPQPTLAQSALPAAVEPIVDKPLDESSLLTELRELAASDPSLSLKLAKEAINRFPDSPNAPEFEWNVVKALFNMRQLEDAEREARTMVAKYPDNYFTGDVVHHLLNHPPNPSDVPP
jgi:hypothetical protein